MFARIRLDTGEYLSFENAEEYAKFLVFKASRYEYEVIGEVPRLPYSPMMKRYAFMAQKLRANRIRKLKVGK